MFELFSPSHNSNAASGYTGSIAYINLFLMNEGERCGDRADEEQSLITQHALNSPSRGRTYAITAPDVKANLSGELRNLDWTREGKTSTFSE